MIVVVLVTEILIVVEMHLVTRLPPTMESPQIPFSLFPSNQFPAYSC